MNNETTDQKGETLKPIGKFDRKASASEFLIKDGRFDFQRRKEANFEYHS